MLSFILGLENSVSKSFFYVLFLGSFMTIAFSTLYLSLVGGPMAINRFIKASTKAPTVTDISTQA